MSFRIFKYSILFLNIFLFSDCKPKTTGNDEPKASAKTASLKVAMLIPFDPRTNSFSNNGYNGLKALEKEFGARIDYTIEPDPDEATKYFREYARGGYDLIYGHGNQFTESIKKIADEFPRTKFALTVHHPGNNRNLGAISFQNSELGFLTGVVAAMKSKTNKVAIITGPKNPLTTATSESFIKGARFIKKDIQTASHYLDSWDDKTNADKISKRLIQTQYDVLLHRVGSAGPIVLKNAEKGDVLTIGWDVDYRQRSDTTITSGLQDFSLILREAFLLVQDGRFEGKLYLFGLREGVQKLAPFYSMLTPAEEKTIEDIKNNIINGKIDPFS